MTRVTLFIRLRMSGDERGEDGEGNYTFYQRKVTVPQWRSRHIGSSLCKVQKRTLLVD